MSKKACIDCRYYWKGQYYGPWCDRPEIKRWDPVRGHCLVEAKKQREDDRACGPEGKYWEPRRTLWQRLTGG